MDMSDNGQAMDAFREIGPGKHYLGSAHTLENFETAFYRSTVADNSFEQWTADGAKILQRATPFEKMLLDYEPPNLDIEIDEKLIDFMNKRKDP